MYQEYLVGETLIPARFVPRLNCDHEHCDMCWRKISCYDGDIHHAYQARGGKSWICEKCYQQYKNEYKWHIGEEPDETAPGPTPGRPDAS